MKNHSYLLFTLIEKNIFRYIITCCKKNLFHNTSPSSVLKILCTFFLRCEGIYFSAYYFHAECEHIFFNQTLSIICMINHSYLLSTLIRKNIFLYIISYHRKKNNFTSLPYQVYWKSFVHFFYVVKEYIFLHIISMPNVNIFFNQTFPILCMKNHLHILSTLFDSNIFRYILTCCKKNLFHNTSPSIVLKIHCTFVLRCKGIYFSAYYFHTECEHFFFNQTFPITCIKNNFYILSTLIRKNIFLYIVSYNRKKNNFTSLPHQVCWKSYVHFFYVGKKYIFLNIISTPNVNIFFLIKLSPSHA